MSGKQVNSSPTNPQMIRNEPAIELLEGDIHAFLEGGSGNKNLFRRITEAQKGMTELNSKVASFYKLAACAAMRHMGLHGDRVVAARLMANTQNELLKKQLLDFLNEFSGTKFDTTGSLISSSKKLPRIGEALAAKFPTAPVSKHINVKLNDVFTYLDQQSPKYDLSHYSNEELMKIWHLSVRTISVKVDGQTKPTPVEDLLKLVSNEWIKRFKGKLGKDGYFRWPKTTVKTNSLTNLKIHSCQMIQSDGVLSLFGYRVGKSQGLPCKHRRVLLIAIFQSVIPPFFSIEYLEEWGMPETPERLRKMANTIAAEIRNAKRRKAVDMARAIQEWEADLLYLYQTIYVGKFKFRWPKLH